MIKKAVLGMMALSVLAISCDDEDDNGMPSETNANLTLNLSGLENLGDNFRYEGWILVEGQDGPVSTGIFSVDDEGNLSQTQFPVNSVALAAANAFVLSIEPFPDSDPAPAATKYLRADFGEGDSARVAEVGLGPVGGSFENASGTFFLRAPTDEAPGSENNGNDEYGVWFGNPGMPPTPALTLPTLNEGWVYEGWVVTENGPLSTGTFTEFDVRDNNAMSEGDDRFSATAFDGPPIPGEDFFMNAPDGFEFPLDIRGRKIVISVEPSPDNSPMPFTLKPLDGEAGQDTAPATYDLELNTGSFPTGTISR